MIINRIYGGYGALKIAVLAILLLAGGAGAAMPVTIDYPKNNSSFLQGEMVMFSGNANGGIAPYNYSWTSNIDGFIGNASTIYNSPFDGNRTHILTFSLSPGTHTITMTVNDSSGQTNNTSINLTVNLAATTNISGQSATGAMTWNALNFPALTTETLNVKSLTGRDIMGNGLWYNTTRQLVPYWVYSATGKTVDYGLNGGGYYAKVGWFGTSYVALKGKAKKFTKLILEQNSTSGSRKTLAVGETWDMGDGWTLTVVSIDATGSPRKARLWLRKNNVSKYDNVSADGEVYTYVESSIGGESNVPVFVTYVDSVFAGETDMVQLRYTWLISDNILELSAADQIGLMEVMTASDDRVELANKDIPITLSQGSTINIADGLRFKVNNTPTLDYYPEMTVITGLYQPPTYGVNMATISASAQVTIAGTNATYILSLTNNGTAPDSYTLTVDNPNSASTAVLNITSPVSLNSGQSRIFALNVTNTAAGTFRVNVTARSTNDTNKSGYINTTTTVADVATYGVNLTTISAPAQTTNAGTNATYILSLNNNGTVPDSYTLTVDNPNSASTAALSITSPVSLNAWQSRIFTLNVTNTTAGTFRVNVTARSTNDATRFGYINTTTTATMPVTIDYPKNNSSFLQGEMVMFSGNANGGIAPYNYSWTSNIDGFIRITSTFSLSPGTHTITMTVNDSSGLTNSTSINITVNPANTTNISGQSATGAMTWNFSNFPAFWKENSNTSETLKVASLSGRTITGNSLWYNTTKQLIPYKVYSATGNTVERGEGGNGSYGGYYAKVGWFGRGYVALKGKARKLTKLVLEQNETDSKTLTPGETWDMGDGYTLKLMSIDAKAEPKKAWLTLNKSGTKLDDKVISNGSVYTYVERSIGDEFYVPMFVTYADNISTNSIRLKYTWLISDNLIIINAADRIGLLEVMTADDDKVELANKDNPITLSQGSTVNIADGLRFKVNNIPTLDYYPEMTVIAGPPQPYGVSLTNISSLAQTTVAGINANYILRLTNNGTTADSYNLTIDNPDNASTAALNISSPVFLNAGQSVIFGLNVTNTSSGIFRVNVTARSINDTTKFGYVNTTTTVIIMAPYGVNLTNISSLAQTTVAGTIANYTLRLTNNGTTADSYNLTIDNPDNASTAALNISSPVFLNAGQSVIFGLNVTNNSSGIFRVNVTARSINDTTKFGNINTTTTVIVIAPYGVNLTNISALTNTTVAGTNATYILRLTNNETAADSHTITIDNPDGATTAALNISSPVFLNAGASRIFSLNVTNTASGIFTVNVTAKSNNDSTKFMSVSTTTTVNAVRAVSLSVDSATKTTSAGTNATYILNLINNGTDTDTYTLAVNNADSASTAALDITSPVSLNAGTSRILTLNVTNITSGILRVNVTARSTNDTTRFAYINTTTTVLAGSVTGRGWIVSPIPALKGNDRATFRFAANVNGITSGELEYRDHVGDMRVEGNVTLLSVNKTAMTATFSGIATINRTGAYTYIVTVADNGPGEGTDTFAIALSTGYAANGTLGNGDITVYP